MNTYRAQISNIAAAGLLFSIAAAAAKSQAPATGQSPQPSRKQTQSGTPSAQSLLSGLNVGPLMMSFGGADGGMIDFTRSNERILLERSDVRSELFIDSKQRDVLSDLDYQNKQQLQKKMVETVLQNTINNPDFKAIMNLGGTGGNPNPAVIQDVLNTSFQTMQDGLQTFQTTLDGKEEAVLTPKQLKRLRELDLQWRGLLALSDKKVADEVVLTADQKAVVTTELKVYQTAQMIALEPIMAQAMQFSQESAGSKSAPRTFDPQEMKRTLASAMDSEPMIKARFSAESKVKASLTPEQLAQWKTMIGQKFFFTRLDE